MRVDVNFFPILIQLRTDFIRCTFKTPRRTSDLARFGREPLAARPGPLAWHRAGASKNHESLIETNNLQTIDNNPRSKDQGKRLKVEGGRIKVGGNGNE